jgi:hypothetical protein
MVNPGNEDIDGCVLNILVFGESALVRLGDDQVKLRWLVDLEIDELGHFVVEGGCLVEIVGVVVDVADVRLIVEVDVPRPFNVEDTVARLLDHPVLQPVLLLRGYLFPEAVLGVEGQVGLGVKRAIRLHDTHATQGISNLNEPNVYLLFMLINVGSFKDPELDSRLLTMEYECPVCSRNLLRTSSLF